MSKNKKESSQPIFCFIDYSDKEFGILVTEEAYLPQLLGTEEDDGDVKIAAKELKAKVMKSLTAAGFLHSKRYEKDSN